MSLDKIRENVKVMINLAQRLDVLINKKGEKGNLSDGEEKERVDLLNKIKKLSLDVKKNLKDVKHT